MIGWIQQNEIDNSRPTPRVVQSSLFFRDHEFGLSQLPFDMLIDESHSVEFDITDHAVENGSSIADHVTERLRSVIVKGIFSNHSIKGARSGFVSENDEVNKETDVVSIEGREAIPNSSFERLNALKEIARNRNPVNLYTALEDFELSDISMVIESLQYDRGPADGESVQFTLKLREVRRARLQKAYVDGAWEPPEPKSVETPSGKKMSKKKSKGKKQGTEKVAQTLVNSGKNPKVFQP